MGKQKFDLSDFERYQRENPFMDYNHIEIVFVEPERSQVRMAVTPSGRNLNGAVHGGLLYTMVDCVAGVTARADGRNYVTQSAYINFLKNVTKGILFATGEIVRRGNRVAVVHVRVENEDAVLLADASVELYCLNT